MPVRLFIQETSGDYNYEQEFDSKAQAVTRLRNIESGGGYWLRPEDDGEDSDGLPEIFMPWHRVEFARIERVEK